MRRLVILSCVSVLLLAGLSGCLSEGVSTTDKADAKQVKSGGRAQPAVFPGEYRFDGRYSQVLVEGTLRPLPPQKVFVQSDIDQADIEIGFHRPDVPEGVKVPIIVQASPYHRVTGDVVSLRGMMLFLHDNFLPHGYAVAGISVRGTGNSGGCMDLMGAKEVKDLDKAITWLATQPWSNGNVAMIGVSYDGSTPWDVAATGNKHLKTIVPISGLPDIFGLMYRNGSAEQRGAFVVNAAYYGYGPSLDDVAGGPGAVQYTRAPERRVQGTACPDYATGLAAAGYSSAAGDRDPLGYWAERNRKPAIEKNYRGSILLVQGLQDWNVDPSLVIPWVNVLNQSGAPLKQMLGQWGHANPDSGAGANPPRPTVRWDWAEILLHWFDKYLKEMDVETGPAVQVQDHLMAWHNEDRFPPIANWSTLHLATGGVLAEQAGAPGSVRLAPHALVENARQCPLGPLQPVCGTVGQGLESFKSVPGYQADFSTAPATSPLVISGLPRLHVTVTPDGPSGHLAAWLYDVDETGAEKRIGWTMMNLQFADGTETRNAITPGQPILAKMEFQPLDARIEPGHRLKVRIWEFQEADRLPAIPPEPVTLHWGGSVKSTLEIPLLDRSPDDYFTPPRPE